MNEQKKNEDASQIFLMLGLALTLPMILVSGPIAGYLVSYILMGQFGFPEKTMPILLSLGLLGSGYQSYRLIRKMMQTKQHLNR